MLKSISGPAGSKRSVARLRRAEQLAKEKGVSTIQIALAYALNQPFPTCALIGAQSPEELESCRQGAEITLTRDELG